ncbi:hypothetical protein E2320_005912 [Naja naja]|nr:hypothetical protein E2320_005912 [Naja naja]
MATPQILTSSPNEKWIPKSLPALEEPVGHRSESQVPPKEGGSCPVRSSRRSAQIRPYKRKKRRMTFRGETGLAKHLKGHARDRRFNPPAEGNRLCEKPHEKAQERGNVQLPEVHEDIFSPRKFDKASANPFTIGARPTSSRSPIFISTYRGKEATCTVEVVNPALEE